MNTWISESLVLANCCQKNEHSILTKFIAKLDFYQWANLFLQANLSELLPKNSRYEQVIEGTVQVKETVYLPN